ncbi:phosphatidylethanolamine-binding protein [Sphingomonas sp. Leaf357]|uniref:YbhB/YbcL family Raf kinase inhibitor-like protein n=1 Tax=Sphingomonas sp. Leaf357 TaxID=1736350 RepID=UPI0006F1ED8E|nr:YbhB/YbcL family Raf kinase inhibitor-like protein [Sphingomonas sp. Leaf357]KQS03766.1 phosphatidylethanolamine-binding protein [Sphingomonas sp. Leaf357]
MLEHVPGWLGNLLRNQRAGHEKLVIADRGLGLGVETIDLSSPSFAPGGRLPTRFTADGEGVSPALNWSEVPQGTASIALIVEDPDAPTPSPLVHAILWGMSPDERSLAEGAIVPDGAGGPHGDVGRNSYLREGWLPPDPPTGHGEHDYVFQLFALSQHPVLTNPGRSAFIKAISGIVLGSGLLVGTYSRNDSASDRSVNTSDLQPAPI